GWPGDKNRSAQNQGPLAQWRGPNRQESNNRQILDHHRAEMITTARQWSAVILIYAATVASVFPQASLQGSISIDARKVDNRISPLLYGQFIEYMFEGVKYGLHAKLLRDRGFEES